MGTVVYANYARAEDFQTLGSLGIDCTGKVVIARYSGNYRGLKAKFAEEAGAAALLIYIDPADSGYAKGIPYPEGGWQTDTCIQRGSINTLDYPGDPLTPGREATREAQRLPESEVALPRIPVQPIGYGAAQQILIRMNGPGVPEGWQGGLPLAYRVEGGEHLRVRVRVDQRREIVPTANVIATIEGATHPDEWVVIGCHHDAWGFGASDPTCGLISLLECSRAFVERAGAGERPARSILFCAWGAEEQGIIGSTEWVEGRVEELRARVVAYINLDMASMGPDFSAGASPVLRSVIAEAAARVPQARDPQRTVLDAWMSRGVSPDNPGQPVCGDLGGGSDHVGFLCHAGIPSAALACGGSPGSAYHTAFDTLRWYRQTVGEDYEPALMIARMTCATAGLLSERGGLAYDLGLNAAFTRRVLDELAPSIPAEHQGAVERVRVRCADLADVWGVFVGVREGGNLGDDAPTRLLGVENFWAERDGRDRAWYRNIAVATDPVSGYGTWTLPQVRAAVRDGVGLGEALRDLESVVERQASIVGGLIAGE